MNRPEGLRRVHELGRIAGAATGSPSTPTAGHVYMMVAGLRFDTSGRAEDGTRWHDTRASRDGLHNPPPKRPLSA